MDMFTMRQIIDKQYEDKWCPCGRPASKKKAGLFVCDIHFFKKYNPPKVKSKPYSGDSSYRVKMGQYQAKEGR